MPREHAHRPSAAPVPDKEPLRLIALSDGLFATVLTLLVLDLKVPETVAGASGTVLSIAKGLAPHFFSYLLTFLVAGTYWSAHHRDFDHIARYDRHLLSYNMLFLLFIGLLPFSTAAVSLVVTARDIYSFYWAVYAANVAAAGVMLTLTWNYARSHQLIRGELTRAESRHITLRQLVTPVVFLLSAVVEILTPNLALGPLVLVLIPLGLVVGDRLLGADGAARPAGREPWTELLWRAGTVLPWLLVIGLAVWGMTL